MNINSVVLVLGKRLVSDQLTVEGRSRVEALAKQMMSLNSKTTAIIFCGGVTQGQLVSEAMAMRDYLQQLLPLSVIESYRILLEDQSQNTIENLANAASKLKQSLTSLHQQKLTLTLLSNDYHLQRIFQVETLMPEQGLLNAMRHQCHTLELNISITNQLSHHFSVPYPHDGARAHGFLLLDELTTYRVYLEGVVACVFKRPLTEVRAQPYQIARQALKRLKILSFDKPIQHSLTQIERAVENTPAEVDTQVCVTYLKQLNWHLTDLNRRIDPEN
ncbi:YdcF family protein [Vibrio pacinii]|uniref:YdcF family protein n=1 Tax=Vibrio pacinii TaxID=170674 RepID=UPI000571ABDE|nr:YdcF family protein [Vibrio pacinii]